MKYGGAESAFVIDGDKSGEKIQARHKLVSGMP